MLRGNRRGDSSRLHGHPVPDNKAVVGRHGNHQLREGVVIPCVNIVGQVVSIRPLHGKPGVGQRKTLDGSVVSPARNLIAKDRRELIAHRLAVVPPQVLQHAFAARLNLLAVHSRNLFVQLHGGSDAQVGEFIGVVVRFIRHRDLPPGDHPAVVRNQVVAGAGFRLHQRVRSRFQRYFHLGVVLSANSSGLNRLLPVNHDYAAVGIQNLELSFGSRAAVGVGLLDGHQLCRAVVSLKPEGLARGHSCQHVKSPAVLLRGLLHLHAVQIYAVQRVIFVGSAGNVVLVQSVLAVRQLKSGPFDGSVRIRLPGLAHLSPAASVLGRVAHIQVKFHTGLLDGSGFRPSVHIRVLDQADVHAALILNGQQTGVFRRLIT